MSGPLKPIGFWSYTRDDDTLSHGRLSQLRALLAEALQGKVGRAERVRIFQDVATIPYGARWEREINKALEECSFFIPIVTPGFLQSEWCCKELLRFCAREAALGRDDLIFPLIYDDVDDVNPDRRGEVYDRAAWECLGQRQTVDFRALRFEAPDSKELRLQLDELARAIRVALRREVSPHVPTPLEPPPAPAVETPSPIQAEAGPQPVETATPTGAGAGAPASSATPVPEEQPVPSSTQEAVLATLPRSVAKAERPRSKWLFGVAAVGVLAVLAVIGWLVVPRLGGGPPEPSGAPAPSEAQKSPPQSAPAPTTVAAAPAPGSVMRDCPTCPEMVLVPAGSFTMGVPPGEDERDGAGKGYDDDAQPQHDVTIAHAFWLQKYTVTRGQFAAFVAKAGARPEGGCWSYEPDKDGKWSAVLRPDRNWRDPGFAQTDSDPAVCVSAEDADAYARWLSQETGKPYRLPSEAEWEYGARAVATPGPTPARFWGDDFGHTAACRYANVRDEALRKKIGDTAQPDLYFQCEDGFPYTAPAGTFRPNAFGLYDMLGNVWQWTADCYTSGYSDAPRDGSARTTGDCSRRVLRGGSWVDDPRPVRAGVRGINDQALRSVWIGFRLARTQ